MADHINLPVIIPAQSSFAINKRTPSVTPAPVAFSSWWVARSTVSAFCVTGMTSWLMACALESTNQRTSSRLSGTLFVKQRTQPGPGPVLIIINPVRATRLASSGPTTASSSSPSSPSVVIIQSTLKFNGGRGTPSNNQCTGALLFNIVSKLSSTRHQHCWWSTSNVIHAPSKMAQHDVIKVRSST